MVTSKYSLEQVNEALASVGAAREIKGVLVP
jgi:Zn-dependent alcohol dehydrogenase